MEKQSASSDDRRAFSKRKTITRNPAAISAESRPVAVRKTRDERRTNRTDARRDKPRGMRQRETRNRERNDTSTRMLSRACSLREAADATPE
jgi:hypothetical protein